MGFTVLSRERGAAMPIQRILFIGLFFICFHDEVGGTDTEAKIKSIREEFSLMQKMSLAKTSYYMITEKEGWQRGVDENATLCVNLYRDDAGKIRKLFFSTDSGNKKKR